MASRWLSTLPSNRFISGLIANNPICITQTIFNIPFGIFNLTYAYACFYNINYDDGRIVVYYNENQVDYVTPTDRNLNYRSVNITVSSAFATVQLKFCGEQSNSSQNYGSGLY